MIPFIYFQGLVGSSTGSGSGGVGSSGRQQEDIALLEKQGLCSQQNRNSDSRCASLPPSSLPRPKSRKTRTSGGSAGSEKEKKCGEYGRLSDSEVPVPRRGSESPARVIKLGDYGRLSDRSSGGGSTGSATSKAGAYSRLSGDSSDPPPKTTEVRLSPLPRHKPMQSISSNSSQTGQIMSQKEMSRQDHPSYSQKQEIPSYSQKQEISSYSQKQEVPQYNKIPVTRSFLPPPRKLSDYGQSVFTPKPPQNAPLVRRGSLNRDQSQLPGPPKSSIPGPNKYRIQF